MVRASQGLAPALLMLCAVASVSPGECATLAERLAAARVETRFETEGAEVLQVVVGSDAVALLLSKADSSIVVEYNLSGIRRFRHSKKDTSEHPIISSIQLSDDGSTLVLSGRGGFEASRYDIRGSDLQMSDSCIRVNADILVSPTGRFFCTRHNDATDPRFTIFDRRGNEIRTFQDPKDHWACQFLDDERLFVADPEGIRIIDVPNGDISF